MPSALSWIPTPKSEAEPAQVAAPRCSSGKFRLPVLVSGTVQILAVTN